VSRFPPTSTPVTLEGARPVVAPHARTLASVAGVAAAYAASAWLSHVGGAAGLSASVMWAPAGLALAAMLLLGLRAAPGVALGALTASLVLHASPAQALLTAAGAAASALTGSWLLLRAADFSNRLDRPRQVLMLVAFGAFLAPMANATLAAAGTAIDAGAVGERALASWVANWARDALSVLLFTPLVLAWVVPRTPEMRGTRSLTSVGLALLQVLVHVYVFLGQSGPLAYLCMPVAMLCALYLGLRWSA